MARKHETGGRGESAAMWRPRLWICLVLAVALAAIVLWLFGLSPWAAAVVALLVACPLVIAWGVLTGFGTETVRGRRK
jgi:hypothetical protein